MHDDDYWQEDGGRNWVANIDATEALLEPLSVHLYDRAAAQSGEAVLDVGCGGGRTSLALARSVGEQGRVVGVDVSGPILAVAQERGAEVDNLEFKLANAETANLGAERFDLLFSRFGVMFFDDPLAAFTNLRRSLKPGGRLTFLTWRSMEENPWLSAPAAVAFEILPPPEPPDPTAPGPFSLADEVRTTDLLEAAGFNAVSHVPVNHEMHWPDVESTLNYLLNMGPAGAMLREADDVDLEQEVRTAVGDLLDTFLKGDGVRMQSAVWLVTASK
jgi:SAM-dependent methyltransferase